MTRDDLRPHGHTKTGDGGKIDGIDVDSDGDPYVSGTDDDGNSTLDSAASGGVTQVDSGTTTVQNTAFNDATNDVAVDNVSADANLIVRGYPTNGYSEEWIDDGTVHASAAGIILVQTGGTWYIRVVERADVEITVDWTVYEL